MKKIKDLPIGALVTEVDTKYRNSPIIWKVAAKNHPGYPSSSVTLISHRILCLKCFDAKEPRNPDSNQEYSGNSSYRISNISQWLNSDKQSWYAAQHSYDAPPNLSNAGMLPYESERGFMYYFSNAFKNALLTTGIKCTGNALEGGVNSVKTIYQKLFLPSMAEVGLAVNSTSSYYAIYQPEGTPFPLFNSNESRRMYPSYEAITYDKYPGISLSSNEAYYWRLRTANRDSVRNAFSVAPYGALKTYNSDEVYFPVGICPVCNIKEDINVSDNSSGSYGAHIIIWNNPPSISLNGVSDIGLQQNEFSRTYSVTDADSDTVTVTEKLDNRLKKTEAVTLGQQRTIEITKNEWIRLTNGKHKLVIEADDNNGGLSTAEYTFTKQENKVVVNLKVKADCDERPTKVLVTPTWEKEGSIVKVEACNNMNDEAPTWEDITDRVLINKPSYLSNETKTAEKWKIGIKITMKKNEGYNQEISLSSIGGAYE